MFQKTVRLRLEEQFRRSAARGEMLEVEEFDANVSRRIEARCYPFGAGLAVHLRDVTARHKSQEQLRLLESSIARLNDIVIITEAGPFNAPGPRIVFVNEAFERRTGYSPQEVLGRTPRLLQGPGTQRKELDRIRSAMEQWQPARVDLINYKKNGEAFWVDLEVSPVWDNERRLTHWVAVGRDITERKMAEEKIQYLAFYDPLTRLPNRQLLLDRLQRALGDHDRPHEGALMFIDLDNFKVLNDTLGHQKGDLLLQQVAERLRSCVARGDTVARLGGDEFVILLENSGNKPLEPAAGARIVSERILARLGEPYVLSGHLHHSTCSIGVTLFGRAPWTVSELLKQADLAMYQAKNSGRNTVCFFDPEMQAVATANAALATDLREAWREGQFLIDYQPQVGADGRMTGVEALLRWKHPNRDMVPPSHFIPTAEETSLIIPIGRWVLEQACEQLAVWALRPDRRHLSIAVNVSVRQFRAPGFRGRGDDGHQARRHPAGKAEAGAHRKPAGRRHRSHRGQDGQPQGDGRDPVAGRFRHGLFIAVLPQAAAAGPAQDRPRVRQGHPHRRQRRRHRAHHRRAGAKPGAGRDRRGRGNRGAASLPRAAGLLRIPGLPVLPAAAHR